MGKRNRKKFRRESEKAELLLKKVARELDKCNTLGIKMNHGIIMSKYGYVIPHKRKWVVRMLIDTGRLFDDGED